MCCLFGLIDTRQQYSGVEKSRMLHALATAAEARGTDAAGYACNGSGGLIIRRSPVPGHKLRFSISDATVAVMGHTRMATQGDARRNRNNHPFAGSINGARFAFAHNGVIYNDHELRERFKLPYTKIETDSYIAVQLLETQEALNFDALRFAAEQLEGSFTFTALGEQNDLYIVKGDNPLSLIRLYLCENRVYTRTTGAISTTLKTDESRYVTISPSITALLRRWKEEQAAFFDHLGITPSGYVATADSGKPMHPDSPTDWLANFAKRHDLPPIHPHKFRHTQASLLISDGVDILTVSKRLGHAKVSTTLDIYSHVLAKSDRQASDALDALIFQKKEG